LKIPKNSRKNLNKKYPKNKKLTKSQSNKSTKKNQTLKEQQTKKVPKRNNKLKGKIQKVQQKNLQSFYPAQLSGHCTY
jgi:hypothetical protein